MEEETQSTSNQNVNNEQAPKSKRNKKTLILFVLFLLLLVALGAFFVTLIQDRDEQIRTKDAEIQSLIQSTANQEAEETSQVEQNPEEDQENAAELPVIVFTPGGLFEASETEEITTKLLNPYTDYYDETEQQIASIHVQHNTVNSEDTDYVIMTIFADGEYESFLYGDNSVTKQPWYQPICGIGDCVFSEEYKQKYPEVVRESTKDE